MNKKLITLLAAVTTTYGCLNAQTFTNLTGAPMWNTNQSAIIEWPTSNYNGQLFAHKIYNQDLGNGLVTLSVAGRHGGGQYKDILNVTSTGRVGIGTLSPGVKLEIVDDNNSANTYVPLLKLKSNNWICNQEAVIEFWNGGVNKNFATSKIISKMDGCGGEGEALVFETQTAGQTSTTPKMKIANDGKVTIGSTLSSANAHANTFKLSVSGKIVCKEMVVTQGPWADFVFDKDYELMPLKEVEIFYKSNNHLPDVPTTSEITEAGNDLGKTDALLLQKIEELTLYIVAQEKRIEALEKLKDVKAK